MTGQLCSKDCRQAGFTLVELAVVMIIIGLLIGGVLKGQELIANAQVTATSSQIKGIDAATTTFRDMYDAFPGDMLSPTTRLPNCGAAPCNVAGNGDTRLNDAPGAAPAGEGQQFFVHLAAADLVTGISNDGTNAWGDIYPEAEIAGGLQVGYTGGGALGAGAAARAGHYLVLQSTPGVAAADDALTEQQAFRIDNKLDDGNGSTGTVYSSAAASTCVDANGVYQESQQTVTCDLYIRFQN